MAVAALSTSVIALVSGSAPAPTPAAGETSEAFAKLVSRATSDEQAPQGRAAPQAAEDESETTEAKAEQTATTIDGETKAAPAEKVDLLAELEAIFAAAAQIGVTTPMPIAVPTASVAPKAITVTPDPVAPDMAGSPKAATSVPSLTAPVGLPIAAPTTRMASFATAAAEIVGPHDQAITTAQRVTTAPQITAAPATESAATTTLRRDIAAIVASLKAAFHPIEASNDGPAAAPAAPAPSLAANVVALPLVQTAPATPELTAPATAVPLAHAAGSTPVEGEVPAEQTAIASVATETVTNKVARHIAATVIPSVSGDRPAPEAAAKAIESAPPVAALADAPVSGSAEESAAPAAPAIGSPPLATAPVAPAAGPPSNWNDAPAADIATTAPNHAEQSVVRHLDLARDTRWLDQLARDISQSASQQGHLKFQLNPEHLGALTVEIANSAAGTAIKLTAETDHARAIIADAQPRLLAEVRAQGLRVAESHVDLNQQGGGNSAFAQGQQRQSSEDSKPFVRTQTVNRDDAGDSAPREDGELYA